MAYKYEWGGFIPDGAINKAIASWQDKQPEREQDCASPSSLLDCPRVVWLKKQAVAPKFSLGWGKKQRFMLGRQLENMIAKQLDDEELLIYHWADNYFGESDKFAHGEGLDRIEGTPDLLLKVDGKVAISDSKTSRADSFFYVPTSLDEIWDDPYWYKYKLQLTAYYLLCLWNKDWFSLHRELMGEPMLPLPEACHLFSYALDDGIVRREFTWTPSKADAAEVLKLTRRWNSAYQSPIMPNCTCIEEDGVKFCYYTTEQETTKKGAKLGVKCCDINVKEKANVGQ